MIRLKARRAGEYEVESYGLREDGTVAEGTVGYLATIRRVRSGASQWVVSDDGGPLFIVGRWGNGKPPSARKFPSLTVALDTVIRHFGETASAAELVDRAMVEGGRAKRRRGRL